MKSIKQGAIALTLLAVVLGAGIQNVKAVTNQDVQVGYVHAVDNNHSELHAFFGNLIDEIENCSLDETQKIADTLTGFSYGTTQQAPFDDETKSIIREYLPQVLDRINHAHANDRQLNESLHTIHTDLTPRR